MPGSRLKYWRSRSATLDDEERRFIEGIAKHRCMVTNVIAERASGANFAYSTGLTDQLGIPELAIFGLPGDVMHGMINRMREFAEAGVQLAAGRRYREVIEKFEIAALAVDRAHYRDHFGWSLWYYGHGDFEVLQLVWPDNDGVWPWEPGFAAALRAQQPLLGPLPAHTRLH
jgi:hypothetical protein